MTVKLRKDPVKKSAPPAKLSSEALEAQVKAFLAKGGEIEYVDHGVSGRLETTGRKHIVISSKPKPESES